ncbi:CpaD family pilus assembly protein [Novosphingobium sp. Gsoil 351]|uniref:CpaD family pilus assembly protein n=1 Tax=Novosphingobium sp. Gsoil 351 TaxID=2675225 RepID=UPI0012B4EA9D|nr:CpaD family pilus assembly protein [Novosphingobium sp. Gsoil 351]QGN55332.1 pilus assembly protein CpaD [Novosphingobium sp. Gsoil 351]
MTQTLFRAIAPALTPLLLGALGVGLSGCATNRQLESLNQPVVSRTNYTLDVASYGGVVPLPEQRRLAGWFEALDLRYGDRISIDDPGASGASREAIAAIAARYGLLVGDDAPVTTGQIAPGTVRVIVSRSSATVPNCPNWSAKSDVNLNNATYSNYGCAVNSNLASMVADPEHLLHGAKGTGETVVMSSSKAIDSYREAKPTGEQGLKQASTESGGK